MRFNAKNRQDSSTSKASVINILINKDRLSPIDVLTVDKHSRLTLTKKVKKIIPLNPENKIIVYQDTSTKNILLKVQNEETTVDSWILTKSKENASIGNSSNFAVGEETEINGTDRDKEIDSNNNEKEDKFDIYKQKTLYNMPIILVDDEKDLLMSFHLLLKIEGYRNLKTFSDSKTVLKHLSDIDQSHYKLAIIDIRMPEINGIQLYQILKILNPSIKIIFMTALDAVKELASIYSEVKPSDIMKKPIDPEKFVKTVNDKVKDIGIND
ncbi:MAG: response regulator [Candidatus Nitrosocosmicus sp.]